MKPLSVMEVALQRPKAKGQCSSASTRLGPPFDKKGLGHCCGKFGASVRFSVYKYGLTQIELHATVSTL